jgi:SAM-dependent methyltransferase
MNWHRRYLQQAAWTRELRLYLFEKAGLAQARRVLEVGCGTGAILGDLSTRAALQGLDLDPDALTKCRLAAPTALLARGDALSLPFPSQIFDITYCHFLLLWVKDPLQALREMRRVTRSGGSVLALAEPDYRARTDKPDELAVLGKQQTESLRSQGADPGLGARLADLFFRAGIRIVETGAIQSRGKEALAIHEWEDEWAVLESDLAGRVTADEIQRMKVVDQGARARGERVLDVPTYFAWGQV